MSDMTIGFAITGSFCTFKPEQCADRGSSGRCIADSAWGNPQLFWKSSRETDDRG